MKRSDDISHDEILMVLRDQAISRAIGELEAAKHTFLHGESMDHIMFPVYEILEDAVKLLKSV